ncbi:uncharacterized protein DFL_002042 [Arthrobotrys flagrans]|uniref:Uncharacterized protein n=1 Tax=Arthrobotrys flagrans TaxID=97331 RepID=A0A437A9D5_ARTFL|nr:hypothetical protein DFL_002042 [Arthrobotrys flagrans]
MNSYLVLSTSFDQLLYKQPPETRTNVLFYFEERGRYATLAAHTLGVFNPNYVMPHRRHSRARGLELHLPISKLS